MATSEKEEQSLNYLDAERLANELTDSLSRLDEEVNKYTSAGKNLDDAAESLKILAEEVKFVGEKSSIALDVLKSIGTPNIISNIESVKQQNGEYTQNILSKVRIVTILSALATAFSLAAFIMSIQ